MSITEIEDKLLALIASAAGSAIPAERLTDMASLARANECAIALENLCSELEEFDVAVSPTMLDTIRELAVPLNVADEYWTSLRVVQ